MYKLIAAFIIFFMSVQTQAQDSRFAGKWQINKSKVEWGQAPYYVLPAAFNITVGQKSIIIQRDILDEQNKIHSYEEKFNQSQDTLITPTYEGRKRKSLLTWAAGQETFAIYTESFGPDGKQTGVAAEHWMLINGGRTLEVTRDVRQPDGLVYTIKGIYEKQ